MGMSFHNAEMIRLIAVLNTVDYFKYTHNMQTMKVSV